MKKFRALSCLVLALCLVFYALPRLPAQGISGLASGFSMIWTLFAMLVIGSNLLYVIGTDHSGLEKRQKPHLSRKARKMSSPVRKRRIMIDS